MAKKVRLKMKFVQSAVERVERASGLKYPPVLRRTNPPGLEDGGASMVRWGSSSPG